MTVLPEGYVRIEHAGAWGLVRVWAGRALGEILSDGTLYGWASAQRNRDLLQGRGASFGVAFPAADPAGETPVVVRRNRHGGLLRHLTGELFLLPTRAPLELEIAARLAAAGVPTPEVIASVVYPVAGFLGRSDVMTRRLPPGGDLPDVWQKSDSASRGQILSAVADLLCALAGAGACHADLNLKNIYLSGSGAGVRAFVLDVDRVSFMPPGAAGERNFRRLARSARKWREKWGLDFGEDALERLTALVQERT